jgi:hypothetical protein
MRESSVVAGDRDGVSAGGSFPVRSNCHRRVTSSSNRIRRKFAKLRVGTPKALSDTELLPPILVAVTVNEPVRPLGIVILGAEAERLKSGAGALTTVTVSGVPNGAVRAIDSSW